MEKNVIIAIWYDSKEGLWYGRSWLNGEIISARGKTEAELRKTLTS